MKLRLEPNCSEVHLLDAIIEMKSIMETLEIACIDVKVYKPHSTDHSWVVVTKDSSPQDVVTIYTLKKKVAELEGRIQVNIEPTT
jgi:hypothetical protein